MDKGNVPPPTTKYTQALTGVLRALEATRPGAAQQTDEPPSHVLTVAVGRLGVVAQVLDALCDGELSKVDRGWLNEVLASEVAGQAAKLDRVRVELERAEVAGSQPGREE
jgi:hypothetical protein